MKDAEVWLAERSVPGEAEKLGVFSDPAWARKVCQDSANEYFGAESTPPLNWQGGDEYACATHYQPGAGFTFLYQVTRFTVDEKRERP